MYPDAKIVQMAITAASDTNKTESPYLLGLVDSMAEYEIKQESPIEIYFM
jgi:cytidine deaminase